ncbi:MAG: O-antigen ligase family protein [Pyrinomonadaceae bacterium]
MLRKSRLSDHESLIRPRSSRLSKTGADESEAVTPGRLHPVKSASILVKENEAEVKNEPCVTTIAQASGRSRQTASSEQGVEVNNADVKLRRLSKNPLLRRGHALTYAALFLFTIILYARPAESYPSPLTASIALIVGLLTLGIFFCSQLALEGTLSARPREVNLILLFCLTGLLSIPLAINPSEAWLQFSGTFIRCIVIFIVMVNAVRTERRLKWLLLLAIAVSCLLSLGALNDYRLGLLTVEGYRVAGVGEGIFGNSNDMAFYLVTIMPIAIVLIFAARGVARKVVLSLSVVLMMGAIVVTYSRGAFLGGLVALGFLGWKLGRSNRLTVFALGALVLVTFLALAPGNYSLRILSIFVPSLDSVGSSGARRGELFRSLYVAIRHPVFGIGMGNYPTEMSYTGLVTHNAYTQVAAEMGTAALVIYTMFIVTPLKRLGQIARETLTTRSSSRYYYLAVGLQASLLAYLVSSFFASVAYLWYVYYLVAYAVCLRRMYESETGRIIVPEKRKGKARGAPQVVSLAGGESGTVTT